MSLIHYLLEANLYLVAFYLLYVLLLRSETLYQLNRAYLLVTSLLAFIIPTLQLGILKPEVVQSVSVGMASVDMESVAVTTIPAVVAVQAPKWTTIDYTLTIYGIITLLMFFFLVYKIIKLVSLSKKGYSKRQNGFVVIEIPGENVAFSFFGYLFVNRELSTSQTIMHHEEVHIRQKHSWDVIYLELLKIFNWFNPAIYLLQRSLKEVHEFIADQHVATTENGAADYADFLISNAYGVTQSQLTNSFFNKNLLKRRIIMLYQKKSGRAARLKYLLILPLMGGLLCLSTLAFTTKNYGVVDLAPKHVATEVEKPVAANKSTPTFPGGAQALHKFLSDHIDRSKVESADIVNHLFMTFTVEKDGSLSNLKINRSPKGDFKPETVAEISKILNNGPKWLPAFRNGEAVSAKSFVVFEFKSGTVIPATIEPSVATTDNSGPIYNAVEKNPSFPGGEVSLGNFLAKNIRYPSEARDKNISGKVFIQFVVEPNGSLSDVKVVRDLGYGLGAEAARVLKLSPKWTPGTQNGKKVRVMYTVPVNFSLVESDKKEAAVSTPTNDSVYTAVEINPVFPGGETAFAKFLRDNIRYPKEAKENNVQGRTFTQFIVEKDGSLSNFKLVRDPGTGLGAEALRVLALSPKWTPGSIKGETVRVQYTVPINFSLASNDAPQYATGLYAQIRNTVRYPAYAKDRNIQGRVFIGFVVNSDKKVQDITILRAPDKTLSDEASRVLASYNFADWKANVYYTIMVNFNINYGDNVKDVPKPTDAHPIFSNQQPGSMERINLKEVSVTTYPSIK